MRYPPVCKVKGRSMYPLLREGDIVFLQDLDKVLVGDIVVYLVRGEYIIHRVIGLDNERFITQGDNSYREDPPVRREQLLAKVSYLLKGKKKISLMDLPKKGRCCGDVMENPDSVFQYLTNQFFKGLNNHVLWMTAHRSPISMEEIDLKMLEDPFCQQILYSGNDKTQIYLQGNLNAILKYLKVVYKRGGKITGLLCQFPSRPR